jgi:hypothetical protein
MQRDILWMLEEGGEENPPCIRATLEITDQAEFGRQVDILRRLGSVEEAVEGELPSLVLTVAGRVALTR